MSMMKLLQQYNFYDFVFIVSDLTGYYRNNNLQNISFSDLGLVPQLRDTTLIFR